MEPMLLLTSRNVQYLTAVWEQVSAGGRSLARRVSLMETGKLATWHKCQTQSQEQCNIVLFPN